MVRLGDKVKDEVTGFIGIAVIRHEHLHGQDRFSVQSEAAPDGKINDPVAFDEGQLSVLEEKKVPVEPAGSSTVNLGDKAKDTVTGFKGTAVARHVFLKGCVRISLQPKGTIFEPHPQDLSFDEPALKLLGKSKIKRGASVPGGPDKNMPTKRQGEY